MDFVSLQTMARILAIDYGKKRTGLAVTDPSQIVPGALATVETKELLDFIKKYVSHEMVECIVVGWPTQPHGGCPSENLQRVQSFMGRLRKELPQIPVVPYDERYTSVLAHQTILDAGLHRKARQNKALVDKISATIILQSYMDSR